MSVASATSTKARSGCGPASHSAPGARIVAERTRPPALGYGFAQPYRAHSWARPNAASPRFPPPWARRGLPGRKNSTTLVEEDALPFADAFFDLILVVHGLEEAEGLRPLLRQLWRCWRRRASDDRRSQPRQPLGPARAVSLRAWPPFFRSELDALLRGALLCRSNGSARSMRRPVGIGALARSGTGSGTVRALPARPGRRAHRRSQKIARRGPRRAGKFGAEAREGARDPQARRHRIVRQFRRSRKSRPGP